MIIVLFKLKLIWKPYQNSGKLFKGCVQYQFHFDDKKKSFVKLHIKCMENEMIRTSKEIAIAKQ